jgi:Fe-S-cluster-containing dehydrogenase component
MTDKVADKPEVTTKPRRHRRAPLGRRDLLKIAGLTGATAVATQLVTAGPLSSDAMQGSAEPVAGEAAGPEWHMVIDLDACIGCQYCLWACQAVNGVADDAMRWNVGFPERTAAGIDFFMTRPCLHCAEAPCVKVCPVGATWRRADGLIAMDYDRCIGCRYCEVACPYDARRFNWGTPEGQPAPANPYQPAWGTAEVEPRPRGVVEKCTFCAHRLDRGLAQGLTPGVDPAATPACVNACPVGARVFGDVRDPNSPVARALAERETFRLREDLGTEPKVHYVRPERQA